MKKLCALFLLSAASFWTHGGETPARTSTPAGSKDAKNAILLRPALPTPSWSWVAGMSLRRIGDITFQTGISPHQIPNLFGIDTFTEPPGIGPLGTPADRTYDNGFVNIGAGTPLSNLTSFWSYDTADQVQDSTMVYSRTGGERRNVTLLNQASATGWNDNAGWETGPFLEMHYNLAINPDLSAGVALNFSSINIGGVQVGLNTLSRFQQLDVYAVTAVDSFSLDGIVPPAAPYTGTFSGPGPLLDNLPQSREFPETLTSTNTALFRDSVRDALDLNLHTLGIGSHLTWTPQLKLLLVGQFGVAFNVASWRAQRGEVITQSNNDAPGEVFSRRTITSKDTKVLGGIYLQGNIGWAFNEEWFLHGFARYDWNQALEGRVGPSQFTVDLAGWSIGAGTTVSF